LARRLQKFASEEDDMASQTPNIDELELDTLDLEDIIDDELDAEISVELVEASMAPDGAADTPIVDAPGADTAGLDAAPSQLASRVGAGSAGDSTGLDDEEALDADGADGSDIDVPVDPENPRDLVDLLGGADSTGTMPDPRLP
jgi:hypothetical protein